jgi:hypothetical protein
MKQFLQNHLRLLVLSIITLFLNACGSDDRGGFSCAAVTYPYGSVFLTTTDTRGQPLAGYGATYQINNGAVQKKVCESTDECALGDGAGEYSINVYKEGFESTSLKVTILPSFGCGKILKKLPSS